MTSKTEINSEDGRFVRHFAMILGSSSSFPPRTRACRPYLSHRATPRLYTCGIGRNDFSANPTLSGLETVSTQQENSVSLYPCDSRWFCCGHFLL